MNIDQLEQRLNSLKDQGKEKFALALINMLTKGEDNDFLKELIFGETASTVDCAYKYASRGSAAAQVMYANFVFFTDKLDRPKHEALFWLRRARNSKNMQASFLLGLLYQQGNVVDEDPVKAFEYFSEAAELGHEKALYVVAECLLVPYGTAYDEERAMLIMQQLAEDGFEKAQEFLDDIEES